MSLEYARTLSASALPSLESKVGRLRCTTRSSAAGNRPVRALRRLRAAAQRGAGAPARRAHRRCRPRLVAERLGLACAMAVRDRAGRSRSTAATRVRLRRGAVRRASTPPDPPPTPRRAGRAAARASCRPFSRAWPPSRAARRFMSIRLAGPAVALRGFFDDNTLTFFPYARFFFFFRARAQRHSFFHDRRTAPWDRHESKTLARRAGVDLASGLAGTAVCSAADAPAPAASQPANAVRPERSPEAPI